MIRFQKAKGSFQDQSDQDFLVLAQTVFTAMTNNADFPTPEPSLGALETGIEDYVECLSAAHKRGSPHDTAVKNEARVALEKLMAELAFYVNKTADGRTTTLLSSGFYISRYRKRVNSPSILRDIRLKDGRQQSQMVLSFNSQTNTRLYVYRYTKEKDANGELLWSEEEFTTSSSNNNVIAPVIPGMVYYISVRAINSAGTGDWSDPVSWMAR